ncbi:MAG: hypothetical protein ACI8YQ_000220 [Polaribacter sp.]|jgi:hypothetical protein
MNTKSYYILYSAFQRKVLLKPLRLSFLFFVVLYTTNSFAQKSYSTSQLLSNKTSSDGRSLLQNNLQFLKESDQSIPLIDDYSFRTETDELNANRQEYLFRIGFNGKASRDVQEKITKSTIHLYELKDEILRERTLIRRYEYIANWYFADNELEWFAQKKAVLEDKKTIYKKTMSNSLELDLDGLLKTEDDLQKMDQEMLELMHEKTFSIQQLLPEIKDPETHLLQKNNWISLKTIQRVLAKIALTQNPNLKQTLQQNDIALAKLDHEMEIAETKKVLDFAQLKYANRNNLSTAREFSLGLSLTIPNKSSNRVKINETQLDIFDELFQQERLEQELEEDLIAAYAEFDYLMKKYQLIQSQIAESKLEDTYNKYLRNGTVHPLTLLRIKDSILKNQRDLQRIEKDACLLFIDILATKGLISKQPSINYLTDDLKFF